MSEAGDAARSRSRLESLLTAPARPRARWPEAGAALGLVLAFGLRAGPPGVLAGLATVAAWYALGTPAALAIGHLLAVAAFPGGVPATSVVLLEAGFLALLVAPAVRTGVALRVAGLSLVTVLSAAGVAWLLVGRHPLWVAAAVTVGLLGLASYGLYRYGLVALGLVDDELERTERADNT